MPERNSGLARGRFWMDMLLRQQESPHAGGAYTRNHDAQLLLSRVIQSRLSHHCDRGVE